MKRKYLFLVLFQFVLIKSSATLPNLLDTDQDTLRNVGLVENIKSTISGSIEDIKNKVKDLDGYDPNFIEPNQFNYTAMLQNTNYWQHYTFRATNEHGKEQRINISPRSSIKVGPYFGWRWLFLGYTFDVGRLGKATKNTEFTLSLYTAKIGGDLMYIRNKDDFRIGTISGFNGVANNAFEGYQFDGMKSYSTMLNVYYVFNHLRFSYPAAYAQSTIQRISAGSFILGLRYDHHKIHFDHQLLPTPMLESPSGEQRLFDAMKIGKVNYYNASISMGYAYNWVFAKDFLFNISITPALGYKKTKGESWDKDVLLNDVRTLNIDFTSRAAIVWNTSRWYVGTSFINYIYGYNRTYFNFRNSISYLNFYVGVNFSRKRR